MERMIAKMLGDFEQGRVTRRELIQGLAMIATAGPALAAQQPAATPAPAIPPAFEPTGWKTVWLDHISYAVADYRKSAAFYRDLMGWTIENDNGTNQASMNINGIGGIIIRNRRDPAQTPGGGGQATANAATAAGGAGAASAAGGAAQPAAAGQQRPRPPLTGVINHISWGIAEWNTEKVEAELKRRGLTPRPDMVGTDFKSFHVTDPDGWDLQISNRVRGR
jgi:catechol 2,3-dioxygenase-like lactoylglutathione lyase family enzyme